MLLTGKVAVVTGGTRGIGGAIVEAFLAQGASVVFAGRDEGRIGERDRAWGPQAIGVRCDVTSEEDVDRLVHTAVNHFGSIDVLVNNAGIAKDSMVHRMELNDFREVVDVNLLGTWLCCRAALRQMRNEGSGAIVNISSISGKVGNVGQGNYAASKAAVVALTKTIARESAGKGIRANVIRPGLIDTDMTGELGPSARARLLESIPMLRAGLPDEVAQAALFLASEMSSYITGSVLDVAGGRHM